jgi:hypothetical protein
MISLIDDGFVKTEQRGEMRRVKLIAGCAKK